MEHCQPVCDVTPCSEFRLPGQTECGIPPVVLKPFEERTLETPRRSVALETCCTILCVYGIRSYWMSLKWKETRHLLILSRCIQSRHNESGNVFKRRWSSQVYLAIRAAAPRCLLCTEALVGVRYVQCVLAAHRWQQWKRHQTAFFFMSIEPPRYLDRR